jgi:cytoskeletal protein RodZ
VSIGNSPTDDERSTVGQKLERARTDAGLTVEEVSEQTRVRVPIVNAIEQDDFSRSGGDVYARGHVRSLARVVGLDADALVAQFDEDHGGRPEPTPAAPLFEAERIRPEPRRPNWNAVMVAAIVAVLGILGFMFFNGGDGSGGNPSAAGSRTGDDKASKPATSGKSPSATSTPSPSDSAIAGAPEDKVTIKVSAGDGKSWILAKDETGRTLKQTVLQQGDTLTVQADDRIDLTLGNAGAVQLNVNGRTIDNSFTPGQVEHLSYTRGDPEAG